MLRAFAIGMELSPEQRRPRRSRASMGEPSPSATVSPEAKQQAVGGQPVLPHAGRLGRVVKNALGRGSSTGQKLLPRSPKKRANREKSSSSIGSPGDAVTPTAKQQNTESSPIKLTPSAVAAGIAQGARSLAAGVASLGARALGGGSSPMVATTFASTLVRASCQGGGPGSTSECYCEQHAAAEARWAWRASRLG